ncbi:hypothetical protein M9Y10_042580 [Tritrichomonas musculus]|uniref:Uncharacterized protein n=1 Tax=Tritrichomonas musculus TaxID=1915356 RepID=A0ABR2JYA1_9EUKA
MNIITLLPAPTNNIECKFQTLINNLSAAPLNVFRSYKYYSSFYHFRFTIVKYIVMFIIYLFTIYALTEDEDIKDNLSVFIFLYFAFSLISFIIAESNFFRSPYVSILQNIVNLFSYSVSGIISFLTGLHTSHLIQLSSYSGNIFMAFIIITPISTNLITHFFAKKDPLLVPTSFNLHKIEKWDKKLNRLLNFRREQVKARNERKK